MAFDLGSLIGGSIGDAVAKIVSVFKVDPTVALEKQTEIQEIQLQLQGKIVDQVSAQIEVNKAEAANSNVFVAGWRPFVGWVCGAALASQFILGPFFVWFSSLAGHPTQWPALDFASLSGILLGMLGLAGARTYEKIQGVQPGKFD